MKRRVFCAFLALVLAFSLLPVQAFAASETASGTCGTNLNWTLYADGELVISGTGTMYNYYSSGDAPWYNYRHDIKQLVIENGVTTIGSYAFAYCDLSEGVSVADSVTAIGQYAFSNCKAVEITVPSNVTAIAVGTFRDCLRNLTTVNLPDGITSIGAYAFKGCDLLTDLTLPSALKTIGDYAFHACYALDEIIIPTSVTSIGEYAFSNDRSLSTVTFEGNVPRIDYYAFGGNDGNLTKIYFCGNAGSSVDSGAFGSFLSATCYYPAGNTTWTEAIKRSYGNYLVWKGLVASGTCGDDLTWTLYADGELVISGTGAMKNYSSFGSTSWTDYRSNIKTVTIEDGVTSVGNEAFAYCKNLTSVQIPASVTSIGSFAFGPCDSLTEINVAAGNTVYSSVDGVLLTKDGKTLIFCPGGKQGIYAVPDGVTSIAQNAFSTCLKLVSVVIPDSVVTIGSKAFYCEDGDANRLTGKLSGVTLGKGVASIGEYAFAYCGTLTSVVFPASLKSIGTQAFVECWNLNTIEFTGNAPDIAAYAFYWVPATVYYPNGDATWTEAKRESYGGDFTWVAKGKAITASGTCGTNVNWKLYADGELVIFGTGAMDDYASHSDTPWYANLADIKTITIQNGVTKIGRYAFGRCANVTSVSIADSVTTLGYYAFWSCTGLTQIEIPSSVTSIEPSAFSGCSGLTSVTIPNSVTSIGYAAFAACEKLTSVTIGSGVASIGESAFVNCGNLAEIHVNPNNASYRSMDGVLFSKDGKTLLYCPQGKSGSYEIPAGVTSIAESAFQICRKLTGVVIPDSVTSIGREAFYGCSALTSVRLSAGVQTIERDVFAHCTSLTSVEIPDGVQSIYNTAFSYCSSLTSVEIPASVTSIGTFAFGPCDSLTEINVAEENTVYSSADGVLLSKDGKTLIFCPGGKSGSYTVPTGVTSIGKEAFSTAIKLTEVVIPDSVTEIGIKAFHCKDYDGVYLYGNLKRAILGKGVASIGDYAFAACSNLENVLFAGNAPSIGENVFNYNSALTASYPEDDATWTAEKCQNYGAETVTWTAYSCKDGEHPWVEEDPAVDGYCGNPGLTAGSHCGVCEGVIVKQLETPAPGEHSHDVDAAVAPTCTETGLTAGLSCHICGHVFVAQTEIPATGHKTVIDAAEEATCLAPGKTEGSHCETCGEVFVVQQTVSKKEHTYVMDAPKEPSCTEPGWASERFRCSECNTVFNDGGVLPATGHTEVVDEAVAPDCTTEGKTEGSHCGVCGGVIVAQEDVPANGHTEVVDEAVAPDCTTEGKTQGSHCDICGVTIVAQEDIPATGHTYTKVTFNWSDDLTAATATRECACGHEESTDCVVECDAGKAGELTLTASVEVDGETFEDTKTITAQVNGNAVTVTLPNAKAGTKVLAVSYVNGKMVSCDLVVLEGTTATLSIADGAVKIFFLNSDFGVLLPTMQMN